MLFYKCNIKKVTFIKGGIMKEYLEKALRRNVSIEENDDLLDKLPLVYRGRYKFFHVKTNGLIWIAIQPQCKVGLVTLRKDRSKIEKIANQVYLPFIGTSALCEYSLLSDNGYPTYAVTRREMAEAGIKKRKQKNRTKE